MAAHDLASASAISSGVAGATDRVRSKQLDARHAGGAARRGVNVPGGVAADGRRREVTDRVGEDRALFARYLDKRDPVDREMLVERFLPLARQLARRYQRPEEPFDDLFQVACLGLVKAIDRFDLEREVAFSSYAVPTILGEIKRYFRDRTWSVRVPRDLQELALKVDRAVSELSLDLHRQPTVEEIGAKVGADEEDVLEALEASGAYRATSLDAPRGADDDNRETLGDAMGTEEQGFARAEDRATIADLTRVAHGARAQGRAPALRRRPHAGRDRRAHRRLADAGLAHPSTGHRAPALVRDGAGARDRLCRGCPRERIT